MVKISKGNRKIGKVWNVSLTPVLSCPSGVPCAKDCYAMKAYRQYKQTKVAWDHNLRTYLADDVIYFGSIIDQLKSYKGKTFRWHVAGDIVDQRYLNGMVNVAKVYPRIQFLAFTKNYYLNFDDVPDNLIVIMSAWPGLHLPEVARKFPIAWLSHDERIDSIAVEPFECEEMCESCGMKCFKLDRLIDIVFIQH
jgi:hypothetical protein